MKAHPRHPRSPAASALAALLLCIWPACGDGGGPAVGVQCARDADCAALDDGDLCNGTLICDRSTAEARCRFDPTSAVHCDPAGDSACSAATCDPKTATCAPQPRNEGLSCDDGDPCTGGDLCKAGSCESGTLKLCDCREEADCAALEDGDLCNGTLSCDKKSFPWRCRVNPISIVTCDPGKAGPCQQVLCDPKAGKCATTARPDGTACDDGQACTAQDGCVGGACVGSQDICACTTTGDCADQEDGDLCNGVLYCDLPTGTCKVNPASVVTCGTGKDQTCLKNQCAPATGLCALAPVAPGTACEDGNLCTKGDTCMGGQCAAGTNTCACKSDAACASADDGDLCNGVWFCNLGTGLCEPNPATVVNCPSVADTQCAKNVCQPATGQCQTMPRSAVKLHCGQVGVGTDANGCKWALKLAGEPGDVGPFACEDGQVCTTGDTCEGAKCKGGTVTCLCQSDLDCLSEDDGDLCNGVFYCDKSLAVPACKPNPASKVWCAKKDDEACLKAACDPKSGKCALQPVVVGSPCDDDEPCTAGEKCDGAGACVGAAADCSDGDGCTLDSCAKGKGCTHTAKNCSDGNDCTVESCDKATGACAMGTKAGLATPCNADGDGCTVNDSCDGQGSCVAGAPVKCAAQTGVCEMAVCKADGADNFKCVVVVRPDGTPCPDGKSCLVGAACAKGSCVPGTTESLFEVALGPEGAESWLEAIGEGADGTLYVAGARTVGAPSQTAERRWLVQARTATGGEKWSWEDSADVGDPRHVASELVSSLDNTVWVGGTARTQDPGQTAAQLVRLSAAGKVLLKQRFAQSKSEPETLRDLLPLAGGGFALLIDRQIPTPQDSDQTASLVVRLSATAQQMWTYTAAGRSGGVSTGLGPLTDGRLLVTGHYGKQTDGWSKQRFYRVLTAAGESESGYSNNGKNGRRTLGIFARDTGGLWLPTVVDPEAPKLWLRMYGGDGEMLFMHHGQPQPRDHVAAAPVPGGRLALVGRQHGGKGKSAALLTLTDEAGNVVWETAHPGDGADTARAVVALADGGFAIAGERKKLGGTPRAWLVRTDTWGLHTCASQKACASKTWKDCDDGKRCTLDRCDPAAGCKHDLIAGSLCLPNDGCSLTATCSADQCVGEQWGTWFRGVTSMSGMGSTPNLAITVDGAEFVGWQPVDGAPGLRRTRYSATGRRLDLQDLPPCAVAPKIAGIAPLVDGGLMVLGHTSSVLGTRAGACRLASDGALVWTVSLDGSCLFGCTSQAVDADGYPDGSTHALVARGSPPTHSTVTRLDPKGGIVWQADVSPPGAAHHRALIITAKADTVVAGSVSAAGAVSAAVSRVGAAGKLMWHATLPGASVDTLEDVVERTDGSLLAVGRRQPNKIAGQRLLVAFSEGGKLLWSATPDLPDLASAKGVVATTDGGAIVGGDVLVAGQTRIFISRVDPTGVVLAETSHAFTPESTPIPWSRMSPRSLTWQGTKALLLGGRASLHEPDDAPLVMRLSPWGHSSCEDAGICIPKLTPGCDDGDPCTSDWCDAKKGCRTAPLTGVGCGQGKTCQAGKCL